MGSTEGLFGGTDSGSSPSPPSLGVNSSLPACSLPPHELPVLIP